MHSVNTTSHHFISGIPAICFGWKDHLQAVL